MRTATERTTASRLGSYEILHKLATGGMAELFLARSIGPENFEKLVVLKRILPSLAENEKFVRLFLDEARLAAGLDHPCIAHVYDLGRVDGGYFFTMEYVHGRDIRSVLNHSIASGIPWPIEHAVHATSSIAAALHYAHEQCGASGQRLDIVHRDVSPQNIMVTYEGTVKLLDFGVAKMTTSSSKTRTGSLKGKVSYMSPEQAKGAAIDRRSDIFSLGIVLWEMITMKRLFKADNDLATLQLIINESPPPPSSVRADCPVELDRIVMRALATDPTKRYQTAQELQLDIEHLARERKLNQSPIALAGQMSLLFGRDIEAWKQARASGASLADHIIAWSAEVDPTPTSEFVDEDESDTQTSLPRAPEADDERTEQTRPPVVAAPAPSAPATATAAPAPEAALAAPPVAAKPKPKRRKPIRDYAIVKEPSVVIEPELVEQAATMIGPAPVAPAPAAVAPALVAPPLALAPTAPPPDAPMPVAPPPVAAVPVEPVYPRALAPDAAPPPPVAAFALAPEREPAYTTAVTLAPRRRLGLVLGLLGAASVAAITLAIVLRGGEAPASAPASGSVHASEPAAPAAPAAAEPPNAPPAPASAQAAVAPAPAAVAPAIEAHPAAPHRPTPPPSAPLAKTAPAVFHHHAAPKPAVVEPPAPKVAPKYDPNAALPPM